MSILVYHVDRESSSLTKDQVQKLVEEVSQKVSTATGESSSTVLRQSYIVGQNEYLLHIQNDHGNVPEEVKVSLDYISSDLQDDISSLTKNLDPDYHAYVFKTLFEDAGLYLKDVTEEVLGTSSHQGIKITVFDPA